MPGTEETVTRELVCSLNEAELLERGDQIAAAELKTEQLKVERKRLNAAIREQTDRRSELANVIESKREPREVQCKWKPDYRQKMHVLVRLDTKEEIETRMMAAADLQQRLPVDAAGEDDGNGHQRRQKHPRAPRRKRASAN